MTSSDHLEKSLKEDAARRNAESQQQMSRAADAVASLRRHCEEHKESLRESISQTAELQAYLQRTTSVAKVLEVVVSTDSPARLESSSNQLSGELRSHFENSPGELPDQQSNAQAAACSTIPGVPGCSSRGCDPLEASRASLTSPMESQRSC